MTSRAHAAAAASEIHMQQQAADQYVTRVITKFMHLQNAITQSLYKLRALESDVSNANGDQILTIVKRDLQDAIDFDINNIHHALAQRKYAYDTGIININNQFNQPLNFM